jgi:hypothetical protein
VVADDGARIAESITIAIALYVELRQMLPRLPVADVELQLDWIRRLIEEAKKHGAPSPVPFLSDGPSS